jgi:hypothetical protein
MMRATFNFIEHCVKHPAFFDGFLLFTISVLETFTATMSGDESFKYVNATLRFWIIISLSSLAQGLVAVNGYRNMKYGRTQPTEAQQKVIADAVVEQKVAEVKSETPVVPVTAKDVVNALIEKGQQK